MTRQQVGEERIYLLFITEDIRKLKQGRILEAGADAEAIQGACFWLPPHDLLILLSLQNQGPPDQGWSHPQWTGPSPINHQLRNCLPDGSYGGIFSIKIPSSLITLAYDKLA